MTNKLDFYVNILENLEWIDRPVVPNDESFVFTQCFDFFDEHFEKLKIRFAKFTNNTFQLIPIGSMKPDDPDGKVVLAWAYINDDVLVTELNELHKEQHE